MFILIIPAILIAGCGEDESEPPIIFSVTADPDVVAPGSVCMLNVEAGDPDKAQLTYIWAAESGQIEGNGKSVRWKAPQEEGRYELDVTVSDGTDSVMQAIYVWVWSPRPGDYYPLEVGNTWSFKDSDGHSIQFEIVDTIDIQNGDSTTTACVKQMTANNLPDAANFSYVAKQSDVVNQYALGGSNAGGDTVIFSPELPIYKFPLIPGKKWEVDFEVKLPEGYYVGSGTAQYEVISEEELTVKAGTFQHVFKVKEDFSWELYGQAIDNMVTYHWLAPNVGIVKFSQEERIGTETITTEAMLQSYTVK